MGLQRAGPQRALELVGFGWMGEEDALGRERKEIFIYQVSSMCWMLSGCFYTYSSSVSTRAPRNRSDCLHIIEKETKVPRV